MSGEDGRVDLARQADATIATIDNALTDWSVSRDAMRWTTELDAQPTYPPRAFEPWDALRIRLDMELMVEAFRNVVGASVEAVAAIFEFSESWRAENDAVERARIRHRVRVVTARKRRGCR